MLTFVTRVLPAVALGLTLAGGPAAAQNGPQLNLMRVELSAGMHRIDAQVARAPVERHIFFLS